MLLQESFKSSVEAIISTSFSSMNFKLTFDGGSPIGFIGVIVFDDFFDCVGFFVASFLCFFLGGSSFSVHSGFENRPKPPAIYVLLCFYIIFIFLLLLES